MTDYRIRTGGTPIRIVDATGAEDARIVSGGTDAVVRGNSTTLRRIRTTRALDPWQQVMSASNLFTNPLMLDGTTGWITNGTNTIASVTTGSQPIPRAFADWPNAMKATYGSSLGLVQKTISTELAVSTAYEVFGWAYVPTAFDGTGLSLRMAGFMGATPSDDILAPVDMNIRDAWQYVRLTLTTDADVAGFFQWLAAGSPTAGRFVYVVGMSCFAL